MKKAANIFLAYFPVILIAGQVLVNLIYFISPKFYASAGFYLGLSFGTNAAVAIFLTVLTFRLRFCDISRVCAIGQCIFALVYGIIGQDNIYNIVIQIFVGTLVLFITFLQYIKKFPMCRMSLFFSFLDSLRRNNCDCNAALSHWDEKTKRLIQRHHEQRS